MRQDYISWQTYFMGIAYLSAQRSKDPSTQVGACIVDRDNKIIGIGYNGFPRGMSDDEYPWEREGELMDTKYPYVVHAELNAILNSKGGLKGSTVYVTHFPCNECAKAIIQSGITKVVYGSDKHEQITEFAISRKMLTGVGIEIEKTDELTVEVGK